MPTIVACAETMAALVSKGSPCRGWLTELQPEVPTTRANTKRLVRFSFILCHAILLFVEPKLIQPLPRSLNELPLKATGARIGGPLNFGLIFKNRL
jgi:hypothetical protein